MEAITVPATLESLALISDFITDAVMRAGMDDHAAWQIQLAVDEAATNVIQHGYSQSDSGDIDLACRVEDDQFIITVRDRGRRFKPEEVPSPDITSSIDERKVGGLGLYLMDRLMDSVQFHFDEQHGNQLTMTKRISGSTQVAQIIELSGRLDAVTTTTAIEQVQAVIDSGARQVLLDMSQVNFLSSSGLRALLLIRKRLLTQDGELRLCALQPQVQEVFSITGFTQVFAIHRSREEALAAFGQRPM